ncbi:MAG: hypothetical protein HXX13_06825 [Bacteroidetes bacterium]|nr:hypothetical protein [Bacteroidota bacterium]
MLTVVNKSHGLHFCFVTLLLFNLLACRKESDREIPIILVNKPLAGTAYQVGDSIHILAVFSDNKDLKSLQVVLTDMEDRPVLPPIYIEIPGNPFTLDALYPINDSLLASGEYNLHFQASDGINVANAFVKIQITSIQRAFLYPIAITGKGLNTITALALDSGIKWNNIYSLPADYGGSAIDSRYGHLFLSGTYQSDVVALNVKNHKIDWRIPVQQLSVNHWFESISEVNSQLLVSYYEGYVKTFDHAGTPLYTSEVLQNYYPKNATFFNNRLVTCLNQVSNTKHSLAFYAMPGGLMVLSLSPTPEIVKMFPVDSKHLIAFGNQDGKAVIYIYLDYNETFSMLKEIADDSIVCVAAIDRQNYVFSTKSRLYWYNFPNNSMIEFKSGVDMAHLAYEDIGEIVYAASGHEIYLYSYPEGILKETYSLGDPILDIQLLYNK